MHHRDRRRLDEQNKKEESCGLPIPVQQTELHERNSHYSLAKVQSERKQANHNKNIAKFLLFKCNF